MKKKVTMIFKGATRVIRYSKDGENHSIVGFTRLEAIELDGKNVLPMIKGPLVIERGLENGLYEYGSVTEIKDYDYDELALQIEVDGEFHPEWMSFWVIDFKSVEMNSVDGVWYKAEGKEENWDWYDNLSSPIMIDN